MYRVKISAIRKLAGELGGIAARLLVATLRLYCQLFSSMSTPPGDKRSIQDADLAGDYNFRTQRFDVGNDPAGWYEDER